MRIITTIIILAFLLCGGASGADRASLERTAERNVSLEGLRRVDVRVANGSITFHGEPAGTEASIRADIRVRAEDRGRSLRENGEVAARCLREMDIITERRDSVLVVTYQTGEGGDCSQTVSFDVTIPADLPVTASTENGGVDVHNVRTVTIRCANGDVELHGTEHVDVTTQNGDIDGDRISGAVSLTTGNGVIRAALARATREASLIAQVGAVEMEVSEGTNARLDARVTAGTISHEGLPARSVRQVRPGSLQAILGDGSGIIMVRVATGTIALSGR